MGTFLTLLTGGGLVAVGAAVGGLLSAWLSNWLGAKRDERSYGHEQEMAREARRQDRLDQAYIELGMYLSRYADWARSVQPFWGPVPAPDPLPPAERWRIETLVAQYGSSDVRQLLEQWGQKASKIDNADRVIRSVEQSSNPSPEIDREALREKQALPDYRRAMDEAAEAIRDQIRRELSGERPDAAQITAAQAGTVSRGRTP